MGEELEKDKILKNDGEKDISDMPTRELVVKFEKIMKIRNQKQYEFEQLLSNKEIAKTELRDIELKTKDQELEKLDLQIKDINDELDIRK